MLHKCKVLLSMITFHDIIAIVATRFEQQDFSRLSLPVEGTGLVLAHEAFRGITEISAANGGKTGREAM